VNAPVQTAAKAIADGIQNEGERLVMGTNATCRAGLAA
jgi:hypothetical protein